MSKVLVIAEIGSSHGGSFDKAIQLIDVAAEAGADYAKFQLFTGLDLWHPFEYMSLATTRKYALPEEWIPKLKQHCAKKNIWFLCTPFSPHAVDVLTENKVDSFKIASGDITYYPLLEAVAKTTKMVFLSVGASTFDEIDTALGILKGHEVVLLHCIPEYPASPKTANIRRILDLAERYTLVADDSKVCPIGLSSHLREWWVDVAAIPFHIYAIEKHIDTVGKTGPEGGHSLDPYEFTQFVSAVRDVESAMAKQNGFGEGEIKARNLYRRNPKDWLRPVNR